MLFTHKNLKQALNYELVLKKVIRFNQKTWLKPQTDMNTELRQKAMDVSKKPFFN